MTSANQSMTYAIPKPGSIGKCLAESLPDPSTNNATERPIIVLDILLSLINFNNITDDLEMILSVIFL